MVADQSPWKWEKLLLCFAECVLNTCVLGSRTYAMACILRKLKRHFSPRGG